MKKLLIATYIALSVMVASAIEKLDWKTATEAQYRAALTEISAQTNATLVYKSIVDSGFISIQNRNDMDALRLEADEIFASKHVGSQWWRFMKQWPKMSAYGRAAIGVETNLAYTLALATKLRVSTLTPLALYTKGAEVDEMVRSMGEHIIPRCYIDINGIATFKSYVQKSATKTIKRKLREQGKSFVTKDGVNPVEQYLTRLNTALNAPRFAGLNEWLAELGYKERIDLSRLPSEQEVEALKEAVMYGEKNMTGQVKIHLYVCLGVDGYNQFVKEYNGDK